MQNITLINNLPCSKSYANRALVYNFVQGLNLEFQNISNSDDIQNTIYAIEEFNKGSSDIFLGEGGTTIRFMLCAFATFNKKIKILVHPRFKKRPITELFDALRALGAVIIESKQEGVLCEIQGPLKKNQSIEIDSSQTSQFASSLLLISEKVNLNVKPINLKESVSYFELTKKVMTDLQTNKKFIPVDMSSIAYFIIYATLNKDIKFTQLLSRDFSQADDKIFEVLDLVEAKYQFESDGLKVFHSKELKGFEFDVSNCLDLSLGLVYFALFINGTSIIRGVKNLKFKEVDRLKAIESILVSIGATFKISDDYISIKGKSAKSNFDIEPMPDHRVVMISALILKTINKQLNSNRNCANKSFPNFFNILDSV